MTEPAHGIAFLPLTVELASEIKATSQPGLSLPGDVAFWAKAAPPGLAFAARWQGEIVAAGGVAPDFPPRACAWLIAVPDLPFDVWKRIRRKAKAVIEDAHARGYRRIEARIHEAFPAGCRFASGLGFMLEGFSPCWGPDHAGIFQYARFDPPLDPKTAAWLTTEG